MDGTVVSMGPFVGVISQIIGWTFFIVVLSMLKGFISHGISIFLAEFLFKIATEEQQVKITRVLGNGDTVLEELRDMKKTQEALNSIGT